MCHDVGAALRLAAWTVVRSLLLDVTGHLIHNGVPHVVVGAAIQVVQQLEERSRHLMTTNASCSPCHYHAALPLHGTILSRHTFNVALRTANGSHGILGVLHVKDSVDGWKRAPRFSISGQVVRYVVNNREQQALCKCS